jgi:hypothetical protein
VHRPGVLTHVLAGQSNGVGRHTGPHSALLICRDQQQPQDSPQLSDTLFPALLLLLLLFPAGATSAHYHHHSSQFVHPCPHARTLRFTAMDPFVPARVYRQLPANCPWGSTAVCLRLRSELALFSGCLGWASSGAAFRRALFTPDG